MLFWIAAIRLQGSPHADPRQGSVIFGGRLQNDRLGTEAWSRDRLGFCRQHGMRDA